MKDKVPFPDKWHFVEPISYGTFTEGKIIATSGRAIQEGIKMFYKKYGYGGYMTKVSDAKQQPDGSFVAKTQRLSSCE